MSLKFRFSFLLLAGALGCGSSDTNGSDGSAPSPGDGAADGTPSADTGSGVDSGYDAIAQIADAGDGRAESTADAGSDGETDADSDAGPRFDEAGCPLPTGVVADATDAGVPASGLALWLRADMGVATVDGGVVCRWEDVSGNARTFAPLTATPPSLDSTGLKGKPAVSFSATNQYLGRRDLIGLGATSGRTVAVYGRTADTSRRFNYFFQGVAASAGTYFGLDANTFDTVGGREGVYVTNNGYDANVSTTTNPRSHILSISSFAVGGTLPDVLTYSVDGTLASLTRTSGGLGNGTVEDFSGANFTLVGSSPESGFTGAEIGEVLVYDHALTAPERASVDQHFHARFP